MRPRPRKRWKRTLAATAIAAVTLAILPAIATASIPHSSTGTIHACYAVSDGALRVIDTEAGQQCQSTERPLTWPSAGVTATQYETSGQVNLPPAPAVGIIVLPGPVLPAGHWNVTMGAIIINPTSQADTVRCGLYNGGGGLLRGDATSLPSGSYESISLPALITLPTPDRINVQCSHDGPLPPGQLIQIYYANVVAQKVTTRF